MKKLQFEPTEAFVKNINLRREKHGEENKIAVDINVRAIVRPAILDSLVYGLDKSFESILFSGSEQQKTSGLNTINFDTQFSSYIVSFNYSMLDDGEALRFTNVKIGKFSATPQNGGLVELCFQIQLNPASDELEWLVDGYEHQIWMVECIGPMQQDLLDDNPAIDMSMGDDDSQEDDEAA